MKPLCKIIATSIFLAASGFVNAQSMEQRIRDRFIVSDGILEASPRYGGYLMFSQNLDNKLCKLKRNALMYVDHEGGRVNRLKSKLPAASTTIDKNSLKNLWTQDSQTLKSKCFDVILGPTIDINFGDRSYSQSLVNNLEIGEDIAEIISAQKMIPTFKHFPGDFSGCKNLYVRKEIKTCPQGIEEIGKIWAPFKDNKVPAIVISNYIYEKYSPLPAVVDSKYYNYLRNDLNYSGVIITDALWEMSVPLTPNIVWEIFKKADLLMIPNPKEAEKFIPAIIERLKDPIELKRFEQHEARILNMKKLLKG